MFEAFKTAFEKRAARFGFDGWEIQGISTKKLQASVKFDEPPSITRSEVFGVALRAIRGGSVGVSFTERVDDEGADFLARAADESLRSVAGVRAAGVFRGSAEYGKVCNYDPRLEDEEFVIGLAERANECVAALDPSTRRHQSSLVKAYEKAVHVANSEGVNLSHTFNFATLELNAIASSGEKRRESGVFASMNAGGCPDIEALCARAVDTAHGYLDAEVPDSGKYSVVFRNEIATHLIQGFAIFFCGDQVSRKVSLVSDKLGQLVASPALTVIDDPLLPEGIFSCPFDAQGVPTRRQTIIEGGVLKAFMHNLDTAAAVGAEPTGNGYRQSYNEPLEAAPCNIYIERGDHSEQDLLDLMGDGIYITRLVSTFHGAGVNAVSGDFSMPARGFRVKNGRKGRALEVFTISGNYYDLIRNVRACGSDLVFGPPNMLIPGAPAEFGNYGSPAVLVDGIMVAGK